MPKWPTDVFVITAYSSMLLVERDVTTAAEGESETESAVAAEKYAVERNLLTTIFRNGWNKR